MEKIHKFHTFLVGHCHRFDVLEVERVLGFPLVNGCLVDSQTAHHVRITGSESICESIVISRVVSICIVADNVIAIARAGSGIGDDFDSLILNFMEVHLFGTVVSRCISLSDPISSIAYISICCVLQI